MRANVKNLILENRLEIAGGGWVINDEACTHIDDILDNMALGHSFLNQSFGFKPRIAWQIDPFGHSYGMQNLLTEMGMNAIFYAREVH